MNRSNLKVRSESMDSLKDAAEIVVKDCLAVEKGEEVVIVIDSKQEEIGDAIYQANQEIGAEVILMRMIKRDSHGTEPPAAIAQAIKEADVAIMPTTKSLSHTQARIEACKAGTRAVTLPGITKEIMKRTLNADYKKIKLRSQNLADRLTTVNKAEITAPNGTELELDLTGRQGHADIGIYHQPGDFGNLPAGEAYIAPLEGTAQGKFVVDGSMSGFEVHTAKIELIVEEGYVSEIKGGAAAKKLKEIIAPYSQQARNIAELGIGTNNKAQLVGNILEDEKVMGTVHVAIGDNSTMGGKMKVASHLDGIIEQPTVKLAGEKIMEKGILTDENDKKVNNLY